MSSLEVRSLTCTGQSAEPAGLPLFEVSEVVSALEATWQRIAEVHPGLPRVVVVVASGTEATQIRRLGHWAVGRWIVEDGSRVGEVLIAGERLADGPLGAMETLLHEAAHALAFARGVQDTSRRGRYHNMRYRAIAESVGLNVTRHAVYGWTLTELGPGTEDRYRVEIDALDIAIRGFRHGAMSGARATGPTEDPEPGSTRSSYVCGCADVRRIRVAPGVAARGSILCGCCREEFREER